MLILRGLIGGAVQLLVIGLLLLGPARLLTGSWAWPRAIGFLAVFGILNAIAIVFLASLAPASLEARLSAPAAKSQPLGDRVVTALLILGLFAWFVFNPVDIFRLQLLPAASWSVSIVGALVAAVGYAILWTTLYQNAFAAPIVKDQSDRGQVLIDTGPYAFVRHPFYLGFLVFLPGVALWLGSYAGALATVGLVACFVARIQVEEKTLVDALPGYAEYRQRVRRRLLPLVW